MRHRWLVPLAALAGTAVLATAVAVVGERAASGAAPAPRLATVPQGVLARAGYSLAPALTPPYCGAEQALAQRGWAPSGGAGCPISREVAMAAAPRAADEALLVRVSSTRSRVIGHDRLVWLVVFRPNVLLQPKFLCVAPASRPPCPPASSPVLTSRSVVFVDAFTGHILTYLPVTGTGAGGGVVSPLPLPPSAPARTVPLVPAPAPTSTTTSR